MRCSILPVRIPSVTFRPVLLIIFLFAGRAALAEDHSALDRKLETAGVPPVATPALDTGD